MVDLHGLERNQTCGFGVPRCRPRNRSVEELSLGPCALGVGAAFHDCEMIYPLARQCKVLFRTGERFCCSFGNRHARIFHEKFNVFMGLVVDLMEALSSEDPAGFNNARQFIGRVGVLDPESRL